MNKYALIVAGGSGKRMNADLPKQFLPIGGRPILMHTLEAFHSYDPAMPLILVLPESQFAQWQTLCSEHRFLLPHSIVGGGAERFHSVQNGLALVPNDCLVAVHDGVRPFASRNTIDRCFRLAEAEGAAVPALTPTDSLRAVNEAGNQAVPRADFRLIQTPQVFQSTLLKRAFEQPCSTLFTDDASVAEAAGITIHLAEGNRENIKITTPFDLIVAETLLKMCCKA